MQPITGGRPRVSQVSAGGGSKVTSGSFCGGIGQGPWQHMNKTNAGQQGWGQGQKFRPLTVRDYGHGAEVP